jgi:hypothetical protein
MVNAKDKFREGFIMLKRPFDFGDLDVPLQNLTILWAYSERPVIKNYLSSEAMEKIADIENTTPPLGFFSTEERDEYIERKIQWVYDNPKMYEPLYEGDIVQSVVNGQTVRFYPSEYTIVNSEKLAEIMAEEGYHTICNPSLYKTKDFTDKVHYLVSRGVNKRNAEKWASLGYRDMVMYKPYYELLTMFTRPQHIIADDKFYIEVEGIDFTELKEHQKELTTENFINLSN